jgi:hypothetical protein
VKRTRQGIQAIQIFALDRITQIAAKGWSFPEGDQRSLSMRAVIHTMNRAEENKENNGCGGLTKAEKLV